MLTNKKTCHTINESYTHTHTHTHTHRQTHIHTHNAACLFQTLILCPLSTSTLILYPPLISTPPFSALFIFISPYSPYLLFSLCVCVCVFVCVCVCVCVCVSVIMSVINT